MQVGTRWAFGEEPPSRLPDAVVTAIRKVESEADTTLSTGQVTAHGLKKVDHFVRRWTLTWLEGVPHVELDPESGSEEVATIRFNPTRKTAHITTVDFGAPQDEESQDEESQDEEE